MSSRNDLPELFVRTLRDNATQKRVDRIWARIEGELSAQSPRPRVLSWPGLP